MISDAHQAMLALLADALHDRPTRSIPEQDWPAMFRELTAQCVQVIPSVCLPSLGLSPAHKQEMLLTAARNLRFFHALMQAQTRVLSLLEEAHIPAVILKGAAAALQYPHPEHRCMGDIDILVLPADFVRAYETLTQAGYTPRETPEDFHRHIELFGDGHIIVELHNWFSSSDNTQQNEVLDDMLFSAIVNRTRQTLCGYSVSVLPTVENGLVLLGHINHHLSHGLGLRQIIDWMYYVERYVDDAFWETEFAPKAEQIGMKRLAMVTTAMCRTYLGLDKDIHWCAYEPVCDDLMAYILAQGNFGRKIEKTEAATVSVLKQFRHPAKGLLSTAQRSGLINWKACQAHPCLKPFAWAYQLGRWARRAREQKLTQKAFRAASSSAKTETELMQRLGVTRL